jgi:hypothetical protein
VDLGVVIEECSPPQIVSRSTDFYSTAGGNQKKTAQWWRVSGRPIAYAHEPTKIDTPGKTKQKPNLRKKNTCKPHN